MNTMAVAKPVPTMAERMSLWQQARLLLPRATEAQVNNIVNTATKEVEVVFANDKVEDKRFRNIFMHGGTEAVVAEMHRMAFNEWRAAVTRLALPGHTSEQVLAIASAL
jgi:hypothetical protein